MWPGKYGREFWSEKEFFKNFYRLTQWRSHDSAASESVKIFMWRDCSSQKEDLPMSYDNFKMRFTIDGEI